MSKPGILFLIPSAIGHENQGQEVMPQTTVLLKRLRHFIVENEKQARRFIKWVDREADINALTFYPMGKHAESGESTAWLTACRTGEDVGILSDAGCPAVADPGYIHVLLAHQHRIAVKPLAGSSSILLALMGSGFSGQHFTFEGYLPHDAHERRRKILNMETSARAGHTHIFMETPYRNNKLFAELMATLSSATVLCVAKSLLTSGQRIETRQVADWKIKLLNADKEPCIFLIGQ